MGRKSSFLILFWIKILQEYQTKVQLHKVSNKSKPFLIKIKGLQRLEKFMLVLQKYFKSKYCIPDINLSDQAFTLMAYSITYTVNFSSLWF